MGFRADLDISSYVEGTILAPEVTAPAPQGPSPSPEMVDDGPIQFSTCVELEPYPPTSCDARGFYRALGFVWPYTWVTRRQLGDAYQLLEGHRDEWLTHAFRILIGFTSRREYDATRFGELYLDLYAEKAIRRLAKEAAEKTGASEEAILDEMGLRLTDVEPTYLEPNEPVGDGDQPFTDDDVAVSVPADTLRSWPWGYYLWHSAASDTGRLAIWQAALVRAFARAGLRQRLGVGLVGQASDEVIIGQRAGEMVIFLNERTQPTDELADLVAARVLKIEN